MINGETMGSKVSTEDAIGFLFEKDFSGEISSEKVLDYLKMARDALDEIEYSSHEDTKLYDVAEDFEGLARAYFEDAKYYVLQKDLVTAFGALNYAHGLLDAGVRLGVFEIENDEIFAFYNRD